MEITSSQFKEKAHEALNNPTLQQALQKLQTGFVAKRAAAIAKLPEFDAIRDYTVKIKNHTLENLDFYLETFESQVIKNGGHVHWAMNAEEACQRVLDICQAAHAKLIVKGKSMLTEEINLNTFLEKNNLSVIETDLGEYIIQQRREEPSHIVLPAIHLLKEQIVKTFEEKHTHLDPERPLNKEQELLKEARKILRDKFLTADVGITGANFLIAESGTSAIVTNEGNGDLTQILPKIHIVLAGIEKILPTFEDAAEVIRLLGRSATGQEITTYVTFSTGPKRNADLDGPQEYHVILVDHNRSNMLGTAFQEMLRCIRCGACLNHCPVYDSIGGQAYGSMYPGPMGAVLTPSLFGIASSKDLPNASTFCGRCESVCPVRIPLPAMMRHYREQEFNQQLSNKTTRTSLKFWAFLVKNPFYYRLFTAIGAALLNFFSNHKGRFRFLPFATGWTAYRDFPAPMKKTFSQLWKKKQRVRHE